MDVQRIEREVADATAEARDLRLRALEHYCRALAAGDAHDADVFRVVGLWFEAVAEAADAGPASAAAAEPAGADASALLRDLLPSMASHKFLPLTYQILSRSVGPCGARACRCRLMGAGARGKAGRGRRERYFVCQGGGRPIATDVRRPPVPCAPAAAGHPQRPDHHSGVGATVRPRGWSWLVVVGSCGRGPWHRADDDGRQRAATEQARKQAAAERLCHLLMSASHGSASQRSALAHVRTVLAPMQSLCVTLRDLAMLRPPGRPTAADWRRAGEHTSEYSQAYMTRLVHAHDAVASWSVLPPLSRPPPVDPRGRYEHVTTLAGFMGPFRMLDGNSRPRVLPMTLSDGRRYQELLKGTEDLRQDAVMQQAFVFVNARLQARRRTGAAAEGLPRMRTYGVVPLSQDSGTLPVLWSGC
jgi:hypothetical protein